MRVFVGNAGIMRVFWPKYPHMRVNPHLCGYVGNIARVNWRATYYICRKPHGQMCEIYSKKKYYFLHVKCIDLVASCHNCVKKIKTSGKTWKKHCIFSLLSITFWNFWGAGLCIVTKSILSHSHVDWPCQDFSQGSTIGEFQGPGA